MNRPVEPKTPRLSLEALARIDEVCTRFEQGQQQGKPPSIEELLQGFEGPDRRQLLLELLLLDLDRRQSDDLGNIETEYRQRFRSDHAVIRKAVNAHRERYERQHSSEHTVTLAESPSGPADEDFLPESDVDEPERVRYFGEYEIHEEIARGGMGVVFKARQRTLKRTIALKMILTGRLADDGEIDRFKREAQAASRLSHPNIVSIHEIGEHKGRHYFTMDFIDGPSLADMLREETLAPADAATLVRTIAEAVHYAHGEGTVHRDLKPANILLTTDGTPHVTDFGLAKVFDGRDEESWQKLTNTGQVVGTPSYMSPEQAAGKGDLVGPASDIWSLGAILYACLTGRPPFLAETQIDTLMQVMQKEPVSPRELNPAVPKDLETICLKCLNKEPHKRYGTAQELAEDLRRFVEGRPVMARPASSLSKVWRWVKRNTIVATLIALSLLLLMSGVGISSFFAMSATNARDELDGKNTELQKKITELKQTTTLLTTTAADLAQKTDDLTDELRVSTALRLAANSQNIADESPVTSLLLGIEAVEQTLYPDGTLVPAAHECLRAALDHIGGDPMCGHEDGVTSLTISRNGKWLVSGSKDKTTRLWDLAASSAGAAPFVLARYNDELWSAAFSPDCRWLVTGTRNSHVFLWDLDADAPLASAVELTGLNYSCCSLAFSLDSRWVYVVGIDINLNTAGDVLVWDLLEDDIAASGRLLSGNIRSVVPSIYLDDDLVTPRGWDQSSVATEHNERWMSVQSRNGSFRLLDLAAADPSTSLTVIVPKGKSPLVQPRVLFPPRPQGRWALVDYLKPDGRGSYTRLPQLWDLRSTDPASSALQLNNLRRSVRSVAIDPRGRWLIADCGGGVVAFWDMTAENVWTSVRMAHGHNDAILSMAISTNGRWLVTGSQDKTARLWDLTAADPERESISLKGHSSAVTAIAISADNHWLFTGSDDASIRKWDLTSSSPEYAYLQVGGNNLSERLVAMSRDGRWLVTSSQDRTVASSNPRPELVTLRLWDSAKTDFPSNPVTLGMHPAFPSMGAFSPNSRWLAVGFDSGTLKLWDLSTDPTRSVVTLEDARHREYVFTFSADNRWLACGASNERVVLWDLSLDESTAHPILLGGIVGPVKHLTISPDSRWLVADDGGALEPGLAVWNLWCEDPSSSYTYLVHEWRDYFVSFTPDGKLMATGDSNDVRIWNMSESDWNIKKEHLSCSYETLFGGHFRLSQLHISSDGQWLVAGGNGGQVCVWRLPPDSTSEAMVTFGAFVPYACRFEMSRDGQTVFYNGDNNSVYRIVLDATVCNSDAKFIGHQANEIMRLHASPDGRWLVLEVRDLSDETNVVLWDLGDEGSSAASVMLPGKHEICRVAFSPDSRFLLTHSDGAVRLWDLNIDSLLQRARRVAGRELTAEEQRKYGVD